MILSSRGSKHPVSDLVVETVPWTLIGTVGGTQVARGRLCPRHRLLNVSSGVVGTEASGEPEWPQPRQSGRTSRVQERRKVKAHSHSWGQLVSKLGEGAVIDQS
ncbi:hypothetical protein PGT21_012490 [Puccinia graminis f. sp. tritici]|uniref:Uncharacterized protein n=1 Tax=Puccinia graminis f. sp. tritici TaxID=56615 RepID=A0A5B0NYC6_PUCGR|nr:hypothetical protein PGT21_012490 [Puccinia graminis f. sp. tritici]